mmetsp:Transcript_5046/g.11362  ORF Transcript_5046/g.11362 Transcript_5046/m.11362 type:complete len:207 (+) Transcript_5046:1388-2008(+)
MARLLNSLPLFRFPFDFPGEAAAADSSAAAASSSPPALSAPSSVNVSAGCWGGCSPSGAASAGGTAAAASAPSSAFTPPAAAATAAASLLTLRLFLTVGSLLSTLANCLIASKSTLPPSGASTSPSASAARSSLKDLTALSPIFSSVTLVPASIGIVSIWPRASLRLLYASVSFLHSGSPQMQLVRRSSSDVAGMTSAPVVVRMER